MKNRWRKIPLLCGAALLLSILFPALAGVQRDIRNQQHARRCLDEIFFRVERRNRTAVLWAIPQEKRLFVRIGLDGKRNFEWNWPSYQATPVPVHVGSVFSISDERHWNHSYIVQNIDAQGVTVEMKNLSLLRWADRVKIEL